MGKNMETVVFGKWILAGEHAVLRGVPALVFPVFGRRLELRYSSEGKAPSVEFSGEHGDELRLLFWGVMEKALEMTGRTHAEASGKFSIMSTIPVGAGMGASAALCVAIGRWVAWRGWVSEDELPEFCRQLENLFHGESSGVDIAVALSGKGLRFERGGARVSFEPRWQPRWFLSHSGKRGVTSECINKVRELWKRDQALGERLDGEMREAVAMAENALQKESAEQGFEELVAALNQARACFERWGLAGGECGAHLEMLLARGASAVKPTGSGDGGFALSLWKTLPPQELRAQLIPLSATT